MAAAEKIANAFEWLGQPPKLSLPPWDFVTLPEEDQAKATGIMHRKLVKIVSVVPEISSWTDKQTHTYTSILITILRHHSRRGSNKK